MFSSGMCDAPNPESGKAQGSDQMGRMPPYLDRAVPVERNTPVYITTW
jgi:hypothetical protein